jgi:hypothetical protein
MAVIIAPGARAATTCDLDEGLRRHNSGRAAGAVARDARQGEGSAKAAHLHATAAELVLSQSIRLLTSSAGQATEIGT